MNPWICLQNDHWHLGVSLAHGGKVAHAIDRTDDFDLMHADPRGTRVGAYDTPFENGWEAGTDECFPAVGAGPYPQAPYRGIAIPDHGELWSLPAMLLDRTDTSLVTHQRGLRFAYEFIRTLTLDGPVLAFNYRVTNHAPFPLLSAWAQHALFSRKLPVEIVVNESQWRYSHDFAGTTHDRSFVWPGRELGLDFSRPDALPRDAGWKLFSRQPITSPACLHYPTRRRSLSISSIGPTAYWGLWINTGGYKGIQQVALEVTHARADPLSRAVDDGAFLSIAPCTTTAWRVEWRLEKPP